MHSAHTQPLIEALIRLGNLFLSPDEEMEQKIETAHHHNAWFTPEETRKSLTSLGRMLNKEALSSWFSDIKMTQQPKTVGLILAGNIPMVGFHDVLCVLASGHKAVIKLSSSDKILLPYSLERLCFFLPELEGRFVFSEQLKDFDAVIATGNNNSSRYFEYYFGKVPHIIRKNRNSVAILDGTETPDDIAALGRDIFDYFGMGCRSVSKLYLPREYALPELLPHLETFHPLIHHFKYRNNYDYNKSIYLVNKISHFDNGFLLLKEDPQLASPLGVLHYEFYDSIDSLEQHLLSLEEQIQCVITKQAFTLPLCPLSFGESQYPQLWDYADKVNTIRFLEAL